MAQIDLTLPPTPMLVPVDTMELGPLTLQLMTRPFPAWLRFKGKYIPTTRTDELERDPDYAVFREQRKAEERYAFSRILARMGQELDMPVAQFLGHPTVSRDTVRDWAHRRLSYL
jgi:hypothetical protein